MYLPAAHDESPIKIWVAIEGPESRLFLETPNGFAVNYAGMITLSGRYAEALGELGLKPGDRVAAQVEKSVQALMLYLGTIRAGAIFLPLDTAYTSAELGYFLGDAEPKLLVCDPVRGDRDAGMHGAGRNLYLALKHDHLLVRVIKVRWSTSRAKTCTIHDKDFSVRLRPIGRAY